MNNKMVHPFLVLLVSWSGLTGSPAQAGRENLLVNPDFELPGSKAPTPEGWYVYASDDAVRRSTRDETVTDARAAQGGSRCAKVTSPAVRIHNSRDMDVEQARDYALSVYARGKGKITLGWYELNEQTVPSTIEDPVEYSLSQEWKEYTWRSRPQRKDTRRVRVFIKCQGEAYLDSARFCRADAWGEKKSVTGHESQPDLIAPAFILKPPTIDGESVDGEWDQATRATGFVELTGNLAKQQTELWLAFDEKNLYVCIKSFSPRRLMAETVEHDDQNLFSSDDLVEVFLRPNGKGKYYHFALNPSCTRYEAEGKNGRWNASWRVRCGVKKDPWLVKATWVVEMAIPFQVLGLTEAPADGTIWTGNFTRDWALSGEGKKAGGAERWTTWSYMGGDFHAMERFGQIRFSRKNPAIQILKLGDLPYGLVEIEGKVKSAIEQDVTVFWVITPRDNPVRQIVGDRQTVKSFDKERSFLFSNTLEVAGTDLWPVTLSLTAESGGTSIFHKKIPYEVVPAFRVEVVPVYTKKHLIAHFDVSRVAGLLPDAYGQIKLMDMDGGKVLKKLDVLGLGKDRKKEIRLDFRDIPSGKYQMQMVLFNGEGKIISAKSQLFIIPPAPPWLGNTLGISEVVPPPFDNVTVSGTDISMWGRTYRFGSTIFPSQIVNQRVSQLARPMELVLKASEKKQPWREVSCRVTSAKAAEAALSFQARCPVANLKGTVRIEYDGWAFYDLTLSPVGPQSIELLHLDIPLFRTEASYMRGVGPICKFAEEHWYTALIGDVPNDTHFGPKDYAPDWLPHGWKGVKDFIYQVYVGNDERGLYVVQDREENRYLRGCNVEVVSEGSVTVLRIHLINRTTVVRQPLRYTLGLVATPFKKYRSEMDRLSFSGGNIPWGRSNGLSSWFPGGVLWSWGRMEKDFMTDNPAGRERLKSAVKMFDEAGIACLPNQTNSFCASPYEPFEMYKSEWVYDPAVTYPHLDGSNVSLIMCSPQGTFTDFYLWWVKQTIEEFGIGGLYFDLAGWAGNSNPLSGGGWTDGKGNRYMTCSIFALRQMYKRIYTLMKEEGRKRGREFYIFQHSSSGPITAFVDQVTWGEGYSDAVDWNCMTPNLFRVNSLRPLGTAFTFYPTVSVPFYREGKNLLPHHQGLVRSLIHGTLTVGLWDTQILNDLLPLWKWWKEFDVDSADWNPYYKKDPRVKAAPDSLCVSFYHRPGRVMVILGNLKKEKVRADLSLDLRGLGLSKGDLAAREIHGQPMWEKTRPGQRMTIRDVPAPIPLRMAGNRLSVEVGAENYSVILLSAH